MDLPFQAPPNSGGAVPSFVSVFRRSFHKASVLSKAGYRLLLPSTSSDPVSTIQKLVETTKTKQMVHGSRSDRRTEGVADPSKESSVDARSNVPLKEMESRDDIRYKEPPKHTMESTDGEECNDNSHHRICKKCRQIDLDLILRVDSFNKDGFHIADVGHLRERFALDCPLCQILLDTYSVVDENSHDGKEEVEYELAAFDFPQASGLVNSDTLRHPNYRKQRRLQSLALVPVGLHFKSHKSQWEDSAGFHFRDQACCAVYRDCDPRPEGFAVESVSPLFDSCRVKDWLQYCNLNHKRLCGGKTSMVDELNLIDCESLEVKTARPEHVYVALSYVWGSCDQNTLDHGAEEATHIVNLPQVLPAVVSDAIIVTKLLGFRYLWIDKFCINQNDQSQKHEQIKQMGSVYENSELTIIAAAGQDEHHGLPGVTTIPRKAQRSVKIGDITVISAMRHPHCTIRSSKWATRGWTFQEAILSRRRLVFTDEQVYWECKAMNCYESISIPLDRLHIPDSSVQRPCFRTGIFGRNGKTTFGVVEGMSTFDYVLVRYLETIEEYTSRDLRYDEDSLNALIGVMREFQSGRNPCLHFWGVPYPASANSSDQLGFFWVGLTWVHTQSCWDSTVKPHRRANFPSWSWSGWAGKISFLASRLPNLGIQFERAVSVSFEYDNGKHMKFQEMVDLSPLDSAHFAHPPLLILRAFVVPSSAFSYNLKSNTWKVSGFLAEVYLSQGAMSPSELYRDLQEGGRFQCIYLRGNQNHCFAMILEMYDGFATRAGIIQFYRFFDPGYFESRGFEKATFRIR